MEIVQFPAYFILVDCEDEHKMKMHKDFQHHLEGKKAKWKDGKAETIKKKFQWSCAIHPSDISSW